MQTADTFKQIANLYFKKEKMIKRIPYSKITHLNYAFIIPTKKGKLFLDEDPGLLKKIVNDAHTSNVKVIGSIGGWCVNGAPLDNVFEHITGSQQIRSVFVKNITEFAERYHLDGIEIDWEYPRPPQEKDGSAEAFSSLILELKAALPDKLLTIAVHPGCNFESNDFYWAYGIQDDIFSLIDWINIMAYDGQNIWLDLQQYSRNNAKHAPRSSSDPSIHSPYSLAENSLHYWIKTRGLAQEKVVLGIPFFSHNSYLTFSEITKADPNAAYLDNVGNEYYNGIETVKRKTTLALQKAGGVMFWELSMDSENKELSLVNVIHNIIHGRK